LRLSKKCGRNEARLFLNRIIYGYKFTLKDNNTLNFEIKSFVYPIFLKKPLQTFIDFISFNYPIFFKNIFYFNFIKNIIPTLV